MGAAVRREGDRPVLLPSDSSRRGFFKPPTHWRACPRSWAVVGSCGNGDRWIRAGSALDLHRQRWGLRKRSITTRLKRHGKIGRGDRGESANHVYGTKQTMYVTKCLTNQRLGLVFRFTCTYQHGSLHFPYTSFSLSLSLIPPLSLPRECVYVL